MALEAGFRLGHYTVTAKLGEGGMGEVWEATDTQLNRQVALKILPDAFAADPDRLARFQREAQVLASLNHPGIAAIYGIEKAEDTRALVLELVEGPTLADRIAKGPIPVDEALPIAKQIAEALEAAHEAGVIHRDLKPANIKVRPDGTVKVLDFGLAKALAGDVPDQDLSQSPTITATVGGTREGVILGTAAYMSPEQARGKPLDKRTDVWSFGCVLFEMLTGQAAFGGETLSDTIANVLDREPGWALLPTEVRQVLGLCLAKDQGQRARSMGDIGLLLQPSGRTQRAAAGASSQQPPLALWQRPSALVALSVGTALMVGAAVWTLKPSGDPSTVAARIAVSASPNPPLVPTGGQVQGPEMTDAPDIAITPNGRRVAYHAAGGLVVRAIDSFEGVALRGAERGTSPFVSPDGESIGFGKDGLLQWVAIDGGPPTTICTLPDPGTLMGATWGADGTIVFGVTGSSTLWQVDARGGTPTPLTTADPGQQHFFPEILPSGGGVLFTISGLGVAILDRATGQHEVVLEGGGLARYAPSGHILFANNATPGVLHAVPFDEEELRVVGETRPVLDDVATKRSGIASFALSETGDLAYARGTPATVGTRRFLWRDPAGGEETLLPFQPRDYLDPRLSPEGDRVAVAVRDGISGQADVWVLDANTGGEIKLTQNGGRHPNWTPDGDTLVFSAQWGRVGGSVALMPADGSAEPTLLLDIDFSTTPQSVTPDGQTVVFTRAAGGNAYVSEIWELPLSGGEPVPLVSGDFNRGGQRFSPNGDWLLHRSDESGTTEVYARPYPGPGALVPISVGGGRFGIWSRDGTRVYYRRGSRMMVVEFDPTPPGSASAPRELFDGYYVGNRGGTAHDTHPDGRLLMMRQEPDEQRAPQVVLVQNWVEELRRLLPVD